MRTQSVDKAHQNFDMLKNQRVGVVKFVQCNVNDKVLLGKRHVLVHLRKTETFDFCAIILKEGISYLKSIVEVADFTEVVQELVDAGLVGFDEGVEGDHVSLLCVRWLVCEVL